MSLDIQPPGSKKRTKYQQSDLNVIYRRRSALEDAFLELLDKYGVERPILDTVEKTVISRDAIADTTAEHQQPATAENTEASTIAAETSSEVSEPSPLVEEQSPKAPVSSLPEATPAPPKRPSIARLLNQKREEEQSA